MPRFSIIIPAYNIELYLNDCLASVHSQSFQDWEAIVVDDGSTDQTEVIAEEWGTKDTRFHVIHQSNKGLSGARNTALNHIKGEYIVFLDADDILHDTHFLENANRQITNNQQPDILALSVERWFSEQSGEFAPDLIYSHPVFRSFPSGKDYLNYFVKLKHWGPTGMFYIIKSQLIQQHHLSFLEGILHEDCLFMPIACYWAERIIVCPDLVYCYRIRSNSIMHQHDSHRVNSYRKVACELEIFFREQHYLNDISKSIIFNNAILGHDLRIAWRNATIKRKIKLLLGRYSI